MRTSLLLASALLALAPPPPSFAAPTRVLVAALAPEPAGRAALDRERAERRFAALGLRMAGTLADGIPLPLPSAAARPDPFDFDPRRVLRLEAADAAGAAAALDSLARDPAIEWAEPAEPREPAGARAAGFPDDPYLVDGRQWGLDNLGAASPFGGVAGADIGARGAWALSVGGNDVLLAVADTGIDPAHPEFVAWLPDGRPRLDPGFDAALDQPPSVVDSFGHGTPVSGVMAARTNEGAHFDSLGIAGVCGGDGALNLGCRLLPIKITEGRTGNSSSYEIARAVLYAASVGARAVNLSFAGSFPTKVERLALHYALVRGCVVVAAAGNRGASTPTAPQYPAAFAADGLCIQVGSSDPSDRRSVFSSYGPGLDLLAPGESIWTTFMTYPSAAGASYPGYVMGAGTSFAAPFVTGVVGLLTAVRPELADVDLQRVIRESAHDIGSAGVDASTGWGRLDAAAALRAVGPGIGIWHDEVAADTWLDRGEGTLTVGAAGDARIWPGAEMIEASATVALPDSFLLPVRVWPRVGGTSTVRGGFALPYFTPWAELQSASATSFTLQGDLYRVADPTDPEVEAYLPVPPDQARFGFTVLGRVDRVPSVAVVAPAPGTSLERGDSVTVAWNASDPDTVSEVEIDLVAGEGRDVIRLGTAAGNPGRLRVALPCPGPPLGPWSIAVTARDTHGPRLDQATAGVPVRLPLGLCPGAARGFEATPNPFGASTFISASGPARVRILDLAGRTVARRSVGAGAAGFDWDGRDDSGRRLPAGLYFARLEGPARSRTLRLVHLR